ncbi:NADH:ubiquinone reductase (non-electrogenic) [Histomonas meleagridis]|uniref:NADH:ubiquinone reductase (non-electrogenic) n=1 Tax=Histomonas meleagridis TaxID=135588 RepID=UPI003559B9D7|nr:NADH:ubiquinone reductase (non-electrogenic) [Histomonas meleagridis]KAH0803831.1 NADH:ubiquinone reductase (non-electrogenic) [Histomonas meleagridis]
MKLANFTKNGYVFVATDIDAYNQMKELNPQTIYLPANFTKSAVNNIHMEDFAEILKIRPVLVHQLLLWDAEVIYTDIDIVFLEDPISSFNDEADFEVQSDSDRIVKYNTSAPVVFLPNMGYFKVHPTPIVLRFFKVWLQKFFSTPKKHEQTAFYDLLKPLPMEWINDDTFQIQVQTIFQQTEPLHLKIRYLDPVYFTNAGSAFKNGRELWVNEAHRRNITKPKLVHFFHIGFIREKRGFVTGMQMSCVTKEKKCKDEAPSGVKIFPIWRRNQS